MKLVPVFGLGALRIAQSTINKTTSKHMNSNDSYYRYGLYFEGFAAIFSFAYFCLTNMKGFNLATVICAAITGACFFFELLTSLKALQIAPLALCTLCSLGGGIILPAIIGIFYFNEPLSLLQWLGVVLFFVSMWFLKPEEEKKVKMTSATAIVLLSNFLINGACGFIGKYFAVKVDNGNAALFSCLSYVSAALLFIMAVWVINFKTNKASEEKKPVGKLMVNLFDGFPKTLYICGPLVGLVCASIVYFSTLLSRVVPIIILNVIPTTICIIGSLFVGVLLFKEKISYKRVLGIVLSIIATAIIIIF